MTQPSHHCDDTHEWSEPPAEPGLSFASIIFMMVVAAILVTLFATHGGPELLDGRYDLPAAVALAPLH
jgi:hypothetical protein